jgi:hypothetical protein
MYGPVDTATTEQTAVCSVNNCVNLFLGYVAGEENYTIFNKSVRV